MNAVPLAIGVLLSNPEINVVATKIWIKVEQTPVMPNFNKVASDFLLGVCGLFIVTASLKSYIS